MGKQIPGLSKVRTACCGCGACALVCPAEAIHMEKDAEGFAYPEIDAEKCLRCGACERFCPFKRRTRDRSGNLLQYEHQL